MRDKELKPCPFCGGKAILEESKFAFNHISCESCGARIASLYLPDAIEAWNKRVDVECCEKSCKEENATCKKNLQLTRSDIERMVKPLTWCRGGHIWCSYIHNWLTLAIIYNDDTKDYIVSTGATYIHQIPTLDEAKEKVKNFIVDLICSALRVEE